MCLQIFQFQIQKTGETGENVEWSHGLSKGGETKISPLQSQVTWGGELIGLVQYLGEIVRKGQVKMDPIKVQEITDWPIPTNLHKMQSFLGFGNYYKDFIANYSHIM